MYIIEAPHRLLTARFIRPPSGRPRSFSSQLPQKRPRPTPSESVSAQQQRQQGPGRPHPTHQLFLPFQPLHARTNGSTMRTLIAFSCLFIVLFVCVTAIPTSSEVSREELMRNIVHFIQRQQQQEIMDEKRSLDLGLQRDYSARALGLGMLARQLVDSQYGAGKRSV